MSMNLDTIISIIGLLIVIISNFIVFVIFFTKLTDRVTVVEKEITILHEKDIMYEDELKQLRDLNFKLDLIINHTLSES